MEGCTERTDIFGRVWRAVPRVPRFSVRYGGCTDTPTEISVFSRRIPRCSVGYEGCTERTEIFGRV